MDAGLAPLAFDCPYRILFGPIYNAAILGRWLGHPNIRSFNSSHNLRVSENQPSLALEADSFYDMGSATFADILAGLPPGWEPDLVIWFHVAMAGLPPGIEDCPYPTLGVVHDWPLNFHPTLDYLEAFDYIVAERSFLKILEKIGFERCAYWSCFAHDPMQYSLLPGLERPYDVVFAGNMGYHYHRARNPWLERLARLGDRYKILISDRYYRDDYTRLLNQSKIAFNFALRGDMNMRCYEAAACGAMVMCEDDNLEIRDYLRDGESCVLYNQQNFEEKIAYYLAHDAERRRIAANGVTAISAYDSERQFARLIDLVPAVQAAFKTSARQGFKTRSPVWKSLLRARHLSGCFTPGAPERGLALLDELIGYGLPLDQEAHLRAVRAALDLNRVWQPYRLLHPSPFPPEAHAALQQLETSVARLPGHLWHAYNLAGALSLMRQPAKALPLWQQLIPHLATVPVDFAALSGLLLLPRGYGRELHELAYSWDRSAGEVLTGQAPPETLNRLLLWQAFELSGYCLMWLQRPDDALQAFLQSEAVGPASFYTYAPLLQLLSQSGREAELLACLQRAVSKLGLIESLQRDLIMTLLRQRRHAELRPVLHFYRLLLQCFEGGHTQARDSMQAWIPAFLVWLPELISTQLEWAGIGNS